MFIVFEGGEGVGKSTQIQLVETALCAKNRTCIITREPGGTPFAENIRKLFKEKSTEHPTQMTELFLICAARAQHFETFIKPHLNSNTIILCDRFLDSTYVYQNIYGKLDKKIIDLVTKPILENFIPTLTFVFQCDAASAQNRIAQDKNRSEDRFDEKKQSFHKTILKGYQKILTEQFPYPCGKVPKRIEIQASNNVEQVFSQIKLAFSNELYIEL